MRALAVLFVAAAAHAGTHVVERGQTLEHVARMYGCETEAVLRANGIDNTLVRPGTRVTIPTCTLARKTRTLKRDARDAKADQALAVIDGTATVRTARSAEEQQAEPADTVDGESRSVGQPWNGKLVGGEALPANAGYRIRRPARAYGADNVIAHLQSSVAAVRALHDVHTLAIGDLSARGGGKIGDHHSHQSGLDVDVGFYFRTPPEGYPDRFATADSTLDLDATWSLLVAFVRTSDLADGVQMIFLDYEVQARLYAYAKKRGTPDADLAAIFQYPRGKDALAGIVRHWPNHADHFHVRFKPVD